MRDTCSPALFDEVSSSDTRLIPGHSSFVLVWIRSNTSRKAFGGFTGPDQRLTVERRSARTWGVNEISRLTVDIDVGIIVAQDEGSGAFPTMMQRRIVPWISCLSHEQRGPICGAISILTCRIYLWQARQRIARTKVSVAGNGLKRLLEPTVFALRGCLMLLHAWSSR